MKRTAEDWLVFWKVLFHDKDPVWAPPPGDMLRIFAEAVRREAQIHDGHVTDIWELRAQRRIDLVHKDILGLASPSEICELDLLERELNDHFDAIAPMPYTAFEYAEPFNKKNS